MNALIGTADNVLLLTVLWYGIDSVREIRFWCKPYEALTFVFITIGSFGWIAHNIQGGIVHWYAMSLHAGIALYIILLYRYREHQLKRKSDGQIIGNYFHRSK